MPREEAKLSIHVVGYLSRDIPPDLALRTIESLKVHGSLRARQAVEDAWYLSGSRERNRNDVAVSLSAIGSCADDEERPMKDPGDWPPRPADARRPRVSRRSPASELKAKTKTIDMRSCRPEGDGATRAREIKPNGEASRSVLKDGGKIVGLRLRAAGLKKIVYARPESLAGQTRDEGDS
mgnify:CR=1 FL=1